MMPRRNGAARVLVVLADGAQTAFAAAVVASLAGRGVRWSSAYGAGLGAHVATLAVLGDASDGLQRWEQEAERGCPVLQSRLDAARQSRPIGDGIRVWPDPWTIPGWLDDASLDQHLAPELAGVPGRLTRAGAASRVAVQDLADGQVRWHDLGSLPAAQAGLALRATAAFFGGWAPIRTGEGNTCCGGVAAALPIITFSADEGPGADIVCGFPIPTVSRPPATSIFALVQRRDEVSAALAVEALGQGHAHGTRIIAPSQVTWAVWAGRDGADLGLEYPLPWERNGELIGLLLRYGEFVAERELG